MNNSLVQLVLVHFRTFFREPAVLFWAIVFPILMAWVLGVAFSGKGETIRRVYVVSEQQHAVLSGEKVLARETGNPFRIRFEYHSEEEAIRSIKRGIINLYITVSNGNITYHFDPSNTDAQVLQLVLDREITGEPQGNTTVVPLETKGTRYIDFLIPGLIALGIMNSCLWGISWALIETRMRKLLRRMVATPMKKSVFLTSYIATRIILGGIETLLLFLFAYLYFGTTITGSVLAFFALFLSGIFAFSGIGILTASRTDKSEIGNGLINAVTLTMTILSGIFFNYHNFPDWAVSFIQVLPLTMLADAIRAVFIEAAQLTDVLPAIGILCAIGFVTFVTGLKIFKWY